ncbi:hypothetical protein IV500_05740 [Paeniglutamicibacter antarcticus]|uniref:Uncharacterized protein n=1 Tax=Arthrobacter terrae TaxID=2935737 RepID=A0A931CQ33_9MICC|nr:hypothetical protein [Arthrobacter terrae]MBG0738924.1 hypothetical protein [Arthrobacter terrae]
MEPFRIITTFEEFTSLTVSTIVCPVRQPGLAYRKCWSDLFTTFESTHEWDARETWTILTMHCPTEKSEVWVLWDAAAVKSPLPKQGAFITIVPSRSPRRKAHFGLGYAKSAITNQLYRGTAKEDMAILQLDPATSQYVVLHNIPQGTTKTQLPW